LVDCDQIDLNVEIQSLEWTPLGLVFSND